nr:toxin co-regulated pilus biosynthesis Q family protein [Luteibacter jiangsuensis]
MPSKLSICVLVSFAALLSACGTPAPKDFGGSWKPVNRFEDKTTEIPLAVPYTYYAAPMDGTLKTMLSRWTSDNGMKLKYKLRSDFTLTKAASAIHTSELRDAASQLSSIYGPQGVAVLISGPDLVVEEVSAITAPPAAAPAASQAPVTTAPAAPTQPVAATAVAQ